MLRSIKVENFRAFKRAEIDFSKVNVFVGPNNSGKSSLVSVINLISQNIRLNAQDSNLALNGAYVQLGTYIDVVNGHDPKSNISISFSIDKFKYEYEYRYRSHKREIELIKSSVSDGDIYASYDKDGSPSKFVLKSLSENIEYRPGRVRVRFFGMYMFVPYGAVPSAEEGIPEASISKLRTFTFRSANALEQHFSAFDSVGAFRAAPERTYHYTGEAPSNVGRFGENFAQMLATNAGSRGRSKNNILKRICEWFVVSGIAKDVKLKPLTNRHFEIIVKDNTGAESNITDSGFGCSQVLPVLVAGLNLLQDRRSSRPPMLVVQEPEIHLHPTAAAHLGTFFASLARSGVQCFVETHSENIVLRIARHVALKHLRPDDVRIYWVSEAEKEHKITMLELREDGTFKTDWPEGFFPTRASETMQLARAASGIEVQDVALELISYE